METINLSFAEDPTFELFISGLPGKDGKDGITPTVTITPIAGGHNVAYFYAPDDPRNRSFDVYNGEDGAPGRDGTDGTDGTDGITPTVTITQITGGHNVAFSYGSGDPRNRDFDVEDGADGATGPAGRDGTDGTDGTDGITPTVTITPIAGGHNVAYFYAPDDPRNTSFDVEDGADGATGPAGYTPVRGTDYWTASDISLIESYCAGYIDTSLGVILNASYPSA